MESCASSPEQQGLGCCACRGLKWECEGAASMPHVPPVQQRKGRISPNPLHLLKQEFAARSELSLNIS